MTLTCKDARWVQSIKSNDPIKKRIGLHKLGVEAYSQGDKEAFSALAAYGQTGAEYYVIRFLEACGFKTAAAWKFWREVDRYHFSEHGGVKC